MSPASVSSSSELSLELLNVLEIAVLRRIAPMAYQVYGKAPAFYLDLFPSEKDGTPCTRPWNHSFMLETFITESEEFFESEQEGSVTCGIWVEDALDVEEEMPLTAVARKIGNEQILTIQRIKDEYAERAKILRKARSVLLDRQEISTALISFRKKALYDPLTQIYNRSAFFDLLQRQIAGTDNHPVNLALLMMDIDNFKKINDTFGHVSGDSVLAQMGKILQESLRQDDTPVRYGGEEFTVLVPQANLLQIFRVAEKLRCKIADHDFGIDAQVTVSIGGTLYRPGEGAESFIHRADEALYVAKRQGKNTVRLRDPWTDKDLDAQTLKQDSSTI